MPKIKKYPKEIIGVSGLKTTAARSQLMAKIKSQDTKVEIKVRKWLWNKRYRFRKNYRAVQGCPDIAFTKYKIAVFIDGAFWHGYKWKTQKQKFKTNKEFWIKKIEKNISRDKLVNKQLKKSGWVVLRFWEHEFVKNFEATCMQIETLINSNKSSDF